MRLMFGHLIVSMDELNMVVEFEIMMVQWIEVKHLRIL
jgi:hypothetical protein